MLVFFNYPRGSTIIDGKRIYGFFEPYDPVIIPWSVYRANKQKLMQAPYTSKILSTIFPKRIFPPLSFTYKEIKFLEYDQLVELCNIFEISAPHTKSKCRQKIRQFFKEKC